MPWTGFRFPRSLPACVGFYRCRWMRSGMALHFIRPGLPEAAGRRVAMDRADERSVLSLKPHGLRSCSESGLDVGDDSTTTHLPSRAANTSVLWLWAAAPRAAASILSAARVTALLPLRVDRCRTRNKRADRRDGVFPRSALGGCFTSHAFEPPDTYSLTRFCRCDYLPAAITSRVRTHRFLGES